MSATQPTDSGPSASLTLNLSSNNPFRNRASPLPSPHAPSPSARPVSRNPFLDVSYTNNTQSPDNMSPALRGNAADLFDSLTLEEKSKPSNGNTNGNGSMRPPPRSNTGSVPPPYSATAARGENIPPRGPPGHRPTRSQEEAMRARRVAATGSVSRPQRPSGELNIFADPDSPQKRGDPRRVRRNSESSVVGNGKPLDPEEEKKRQERRRRERRHREARDGKGPKKPERKLDIIDKLDVTSIYGTGLFHHDGPFDACNPHRNRQGSKRAPMSAFAKDSLNNVLGGGGPLNKRPDHAAFLGNNDEEAFKDYSAGGASQTPYEPYGTGLKSSRQEANVQSATTKVEPIHGEESLGLGTSTFLEGAPASRTAMQRIESEQATATEAGLGRKKSLAQKIRGVGTSRREYGPRVTSPGGLMSPNGMISPRTPYYTPGGTEVDSNPFFNEFSKGDDSNGKKESFTFVEPVKSERPRAPSSPKPFGGSLRRRATSDGSSGPDQPATGKPNGNGFLARVRSLKGGPRKPSNKAMPPQPQPQAELMDA